jgi:pimeloyl-ACP methyl ester carboxylesterase
MSARALPPAFPAHGPGVPAPLSRLAGRLYFTPRRHAPPERERGWLAESEPLTFETPAGPVAGYRWAPFTFPWEREPPSGTVLLVHGWEGRGSQLGAFVLPLLREGLRVVALDAPAHGRSPGSHTDLPTIAAALRAVAAQLGDVRAVIAHSAGAAAAVIALSEGLPVEAAALLAPPCRLEPFAETFARTLGLSRDTEILFRARIEERLGADVWRRFSLDQLAPRLRLPALILHDREDAEIPIDEARRLAAAWPGARLEETDGLGHRRILRDAGVIEAVTAFLAATLGAQRRAA